MAALTADCPFQGSRSMSGHMRVITLIIPANEPSSGWPNMLTKAHDTELGRSRILWSRLNRAFERFPSDLTEGEKESLHKFDW
jgi:hypothetical protein